MDGDNSGVYRVQVLMLGRSKSELLQKKGGRRVFVPKLNASDCESSPTVTVSEKQKKRKEEKKRKKKESEAKKKMYTAILQDHLTKMKAKNEASSSDMVVSPTYQDPNAATKEDDGSGAENPDTAEVTCHTPLSSIQESREDDTLLIKIQQSVTELREKLVTVDEKLDKILEELQGWSKIEEDLTHFGGSQQDDDEWTLHDDVVFDAGDQTAGSSAPCVIQASTPKQQACPTDDALCIATESMDPKANGLTEPSDLRPFSFLDNTRFHLKDGIIVSANLVDRLHKLQEPSKVIREAAQAIWGNETLSGRTVGGKLAPKDRSALDKVPRKGLTPEKVDVIAETVRYWADLHKQLTLERKIDIRKVIKQLPSILAAKIQDVRKSAKRKLQV